MKSAVLLLCLWLCLPASAAFRCSKVFQAWLDYPANGPAALFTNPELPIAVVGAGPAGLAALRAFKDAGIPTVGIERHTGVGGIWDAASPGSPAYDNLQTNSSISTQHLGDPWPAGTPPFVSHQSALEYLRDFSVRHGLLDGIRFRTEVVSVSPTERGSWIVETRGPTGVERNEYRAVVVASGRHHESKMSVPEKLWKQSEESGLLTLHSSQYRNAEIFRDLKVLVIGLGNSGADIATEISKVAASPLLVAVRSSPWVVPLTVLGKPSDEVGQSAPAWVSNSAEMAVFRFLQWWSVGHPTSLGFSEPDHGLLQKLPVSDRGLVQAIKDGSLLPLSNVLSLDGGIAAFENTEHKPVRIDAAVFCTGYQQAFPFLPESVGNVADPDFPLSLHLFHPNQPGLSFMTELAVPQSTWGVFTEQAETLAAYYRAELDNPERAQEFNRRRGNPSPNVKGDLFQAADNRHAKPKQYAKAMRDLRNWLKLPSEP